MFTCICAPAMANSARPTVPTPGFKCEPDGLWATLAGVHVFFDWEAAEAFASKLHDAVAAHAVAAHAVGIDAPAGRAAPVEDAP